MNNCEVLKGDEEMHDSYMSIKEFSQMTGIRKELLRFYDNIGLLCPEIRGENNYRYYGYRQIEIGYLINGLRSIDIGLEDIKIYLKERSPKRMIEFFHEKDINIDQEIERLQMTQKLMRLRCSMVEEALTFEENEIRLIQRKKEPIFLCPVLKNLEIEKELQYRDHINSACMYAVNHGVNINFPIGTMISQPLGYPNFSQFYFKVSKNHNAWKQAGTYAVVYQRVPESFSTNFYDPLISFLHEQGLKQEGDIYVEYPLDELATTNKEQFRIKLEVKIAENQR